MSAAVFGVLLTAQLSALLLYLQPRSEWLWFLSVKLNRISDPALQFYDSYLPVGPVLSCFLLALLFAMPLLVQARRSWLGASLLGHLALLICVSSAADELEQASVHYDYASLDDFVSVVTFNWSTTTVIAATAAFLVVCPLNHFLYMKASKARHCADPSHYRAHACMCTYSMLLCYLMRRHRKAEAHAARLEAGNAAKPPQPSAI
jgi:hypothetical protein